MAWTAPVSATAGSVATAAFWNTYVRDNLQVIGNPWTTYAPTYSGITAIGNATVVAKYLIAGVLVIGTVKVTIGSTTTFGAGAISVSSPVTAAMVPNYPIGSALFYDTSATTYRTGVAMTQSSSGVNFALDGAAGLVAVTVPWTWATGDILAYSFVYEAA